MNKYLKSSCLRFKNINIINTLFFSLLAFTFVFIFSISTLPLANAATLVPNSPKVAVSGFWHVYAPAVYTYGGKQRMVMGGWKTKADQDKQSDIIYYSEFNNGSWGAVQTALKYSGYHVNDPTIVRPYSNKNILYMYYTALPDSFATKENMTKRNLLGFAKSTDGGKTWTNRQIVVGQYNGRTSYGAWSPGALKRGSEIWVYYHENEPGTSVLRQKFQLNGISKIGSPDIVKFGTMKPNMPKNSWDGLYCIQCRSNNNCDPKRCGDGFVQDNVGQRINVDVGWDGTWISILANVKLNQIHRYVGTTGTEFIPHPQDTNPIINGGSTAHVLTPNQKIVDWNNYYVYFGYGTSNNACTDWWKAHGVNDIKCSTAIHEWKYRSY